LPAITRKTDKGLPRYRDDQESDVFLLSGAEHLVPAFATDPDGRWKHGGGGDYVVDRRTRGDYDVVRYRPRDEGLFARIERWTRRSDGDVHWCSISRDNVTSLYGATDHSRIADPAGQGTARIYSWLISTSDDDMGNAVVYRYAAADGAGVAPREALLHGIPYQLRLAM
jgi:Salmonella virulence plasmid 65kDa B protein